MPQLNKRYRLIILKVIKTIAIRNDNVMSASIGVANKLFASWLNVWGSIGGSSARGALGITSAGIATDDTDVIAVVGSVGLATANDCSEASLARVSGPKRPTDGTMPRLD